MRKTQKHKTKFHLVSFLFILSLLTSTLTVFLPNTAYAALTDAQCRSKYGSIPGGTATQEQVDELIADGCKTPKGPCDWTQDVLGMSISCIITGGGDKLTAKQCKNRFHADKLRPDQIDSKQSQLAANGCLKVAGGPCRIATVGGVPTIDCTGEFSPVNMACKKYDGKAKDACKKGYNQGITACKKMKGNNKKACEFGAREHFGPNGLSGNEGPDDDTGGDNIPNQTDPALNASCTQNNCPLINKYLNPAINLLATLVGIVAVIAIILGAIQVITSAGDPQKSASGKNHIRNAVLGVVAFIFLYAFLRWLVPGGEL